MMDDMDEYEGEDEQEWVQGEQPPPPNRWDLLVVLTGVIGGIFKVFHAAFADLMSMSASMSAQHDQKKKFEREALASIEQITGEN